MFFIKLELFTINANVNPRKINTHIELGYLNIELNICAKTNDYFSASKNFNLRKIRIHYCCMYTLLRLNNIYLFTIKHRKP